jgi:hypothetical protein
MIFEFGFAWQLIRGTALLSVGLNLNLGAAEGLARLQRTISSLLWFAIARPRMYGWKLTMLFMRRVKLNLTNV